MPKKTDFERLAFDFRRFVIKKQGGKTGRQEAAAELKISQPTFSRLVQRMREEILVVGSGRATQYALKRNIPDIGFVVPLFEVGENGLVSHIADLHGIEPGGFYLEGKKPPWPGRFFADLPYFMEDLRPSGFLGRLIPKRYPDLRGPDDIRYWNTNHCLKYLTRYGWDLIGNLIIGQPAFERHLQNVDKPITLVPPHRRRDIYPRLAEQVLAEGPAGSSAGGEQPKFMAVRGDAQKTPVMVKFSPPLGNPAAKRWADLLVSEHLAHRVLNKHRMVSLKSKIIRGEKRLFLEVERFDRIGLKKRRGIISLFALCMEHAGTLGSWAEMGRKLADQKIMNQALLQQIRRLDLFGDLIANTDKHPSNLSFFTKNLQVENLTPVYDMLPMLYRPEQSQILERRFEPPTPNPAEADIWPSVLNAALDFWRAMGKHPEISGSFKKTAKSNFKRLKDLKESLAYITTPT